MSGTKPPRWARITEHAGGKCTWAHGRLGYVIEAGKASDMRQARIALKMAQDREARRERLAAAEEGR